MFASFLLQQPPKCFIFYIDLDSTCDSKNLLFFFISSKTESPIPVLRIVYFLPFVMFLRWMRAASLWYFLVASFTSSRLENSSSYAAVCIVNRQKPLGNTVPLLIRGHYHFALIFSNESDCTKLKVLSLHLQNFQITILLAVFSFASYSSIP